MEPDRNSFIRWWVAVMVAGFAFVSYIQRMNISIAAEIMMPELSLTKIQMGMIFGSFLWGYAIFQVPAGAIGDAVGPRITLAIAAVVWGTATILTGFVPNQVITGSAAVITSLWILRFLLGAGEAATFPVGARAISNWTTTGERAFGYSLMVAGSSLAAAVTSPAVSWLMLRVGWRSSFYITSSLAFAIALLWYFSVTDWPEQHKHVSPIELELIERHRRVDDLDSRGPQPSVVKLLSNRNIVFLSLSYTCEGYVLFIFVFWLYIYLVEVRGFSILRGGIVAGLPWLAALALTPLGGLLCDRIALKKGRLAGARVVIMLGYGLSGALLFATARAESRVVSVAALCLSVGFLYFAEPAFWATASHFAEETAGTASGIMNTAGILGGLISTSLTPVLVKHFGWIHALGSGAAVAVACACAWFVFGRTKLFNPAAVVADT